MNDKYFNLVNEGGEGYKASAPEVDTRTLEQKLFWAKSELKDAEVDGLEYKASQIRAKIASLEAQIAAP